MLDLVKPSGVMIALFLIYAMQQVLVMIALGLGQSGNGVRAPRRSGGCARRLSHGDPPPFHASFAWSLTRRSKLLDRDNRRHVRGERSRAERRQLRLSLARVHMYRYGILQKIHREGVWRMFARRGAAALSA